MIIAIASTKGGVGKTIIALNLLKRLKFDVVVDADPHYGLSDLSGIASGNSNFDVTHVKTAEELAKVITKHDHVLIDCGGLDNQLTRTALLNADFIIVPSNEHATEQLRLRRFAKTLGEIDSRAVAHVLINRVHHRKRHFPALAELVSEYENLELLPASIPTLETVDDAAARGDASKNTIHADRFDEFTQYLKERLGL